MKITCGYNACNNKIQGQYWKIKKRGWLVIFIRGHSNVIRCPLHKPKSYEKRKKIKDYDSPLLDNLKEELNKKYKELKMINSL